MFYIIVLSRGIQLLPEIDVTAVHSLNVAALYYSILLTACHSRDLHGRLAYCCLHCSATPLHRVPFSQQRIMISSHHDASRF